MPIEKVVSGSCNQGFDSGCGRSARRQDARNSHLRGGLWMVAQEREML